MGQKKEDRVVFFAGIFLIAALVVGYVWKEHSAAKNRKTIKPAVPAAVKVEPEPDQPCPVPCPCKPRLPGKTGVPARQGDNRPMPPACAPVRVLAFTATWCGPCQRAKPTIAAARKRGINIEEIDIDSRPDLARQYAITSVPTFVIHTGGGENRTHDPNAVAALTP